MLKQKDAIHDTIPSNRIMTWHRPGARRAFSIVSVEPPLIACHLSARPLSRLQSSSIAAPEDVTEVTPVSDTADRAKQPGCEERTDGGAGGRVARMRQESHPI
jgi:hypothetical protein